MKRTTEIAIDSFLDGFTGAGLFGRLRRPGAPTEFVDSRTVQELHADQKMIHPIPASRENSEIGTPSHKLANAKHKIAH